LSFRQYKGKKVKKYIIVKYAEELFPDGKASIEMAVHPISYTAQQCNVAECFFITEKEAEKALKRLQEANPTVGYGIVEGIE
jgi:hypothetical protein